MNFYHIAQAIGFRLLWRYNLDELPRGEASKLPTPAPQLSETERSIFIHVCIGEVMFSLVTFIHSISDQIGEPHTRMRNHRLDE